MDSVQDAHDSICKEFGAGLLRPTCPLPRPVVLHCNNRHFVDGQYCEVKIGGQRQLDSIFEDVWPREPTGRDSGKNGQPDGGGKVCER